jgi:hypothetical protein
MTTLATAIEDLIRKSDDKKFFQIYRGLMDFKRTHFIEFKIINRISLLNDLVEIIEDEMEVRDGIEKLAIEKAKLDIDEVINPEPKTARPPIVEDWKRKWMEENEPPKETSSKSDFRTIMIYVIIVHAMGLMYMWGYNQYKENVRLKEQRELHASAQPYPLFPDYNKTLK